MKRRKPSAAKLQAAFGRTLREYRLAKNLSQEKLAELAGINRNYVGDVERGDRNIALVNMWNVAKGLDQPLSRILQAMERELEKSAD